MKNYTVLELFAGGGGMALGMELAGLYCIALNEINKTAAATLRHNRPHWNVIEDDIKNVDFSPYKGVDVVTGGFPCQAFSYAGKELGLEDARGTLFYEYARAVKQTMPKIIVAENVKGLLTHDDGNTLKGILSVFSDIGYDIIGYPLLNAVNYDVGQKRERIIIVGVRKGLPKTFIYPEPSKYPVNLKDVLKEGYLYDCDVPASIGAKYLPRKAEIFSLVPQGGCWRDLPEAEKIEYMKESLHAAGGKTGMARRISWNEPCLTLMCSPAQKKTDRCHPDENRPFTVREYARIQTFPDDWKFMGSMSNQYTQIGNAVPVNFAKAIGKQIVNYLQQI